MNCFNYWKLLKFTLRVWVLWLFVQHMCKCPRSSEEGIRCPGNGYIYLWAATWTLRIKPESSGRAALIAGPSLQPFSLVLNAWPWLLVFFRNFFFCWILSKFFIWKNHRSSNLNSVTDWAGSKRDWCASVVVWMRLALISSYIWILGHQLVDLFGKG